MSKSSRSKAEEQFAATQKKAKQVQKEKERAWQERTEHMAKLRALRLAKEAADKEAAEGTAAGKDETPPDLPKVHRR
jgi:colicin import membrane protein